MLEILLGFFGLLIGSFLNVCIYRWPRDLSVVRPARSQCPECGHQIDWYDNIPLVSYVLLRACCRHCRARIHWRYPLVELLTAACFFWAGAQLGLTLATAKFCIFAAMIIGLMFSDLDMLILPDEFTIGGIIVGLGLALLVPVPALFSLGPESRTASLAESAIGAFVPAGALWLMGWLFEKIRRKEGLGFGDVKMIAMIGAFLGIRGALLTVVLGSVLGSVIGLAYIKLTKRDTATYQLPFGTFLGVAALIAAMTGEGLMSWYGR